MLRLRSSRRARLALTNLQRYILATMADVEASKVALAENFLRGKGFKVHMHPERWGAYLAGRGDWYLRRVAVAVHSAAHRQAVQAALPRWVVDAWTQADDLGVSRHSFLGDHVCLTCLYLPEGKRKSEAEIIAEIVGFPDEWQEVGARLYKGIPTERAFLDCIAATRGIDIEQLLPSKENLYASCTARVCAGAQLSVSVMEARVMPKRRCRWPFSRHSQASCSLAAAFERRLVVPSSKASLRTLHLPGRGLCGVVPSKIRLVGVLHLLRGYSHRKQ